MLTVYSRSNGWDLVSYQGMVGYANSDYYHLRKSSMTDFCHAAFCSEKQRQSPTCNFSNIGV
ncbi:MAG: hypothetical protein ACLT3Y_07930 [Ruminococcus callidus]